MNIQPQSIIPISHTKSIEPNIQKNNESIEILKNDKVTKSDIKKDEKIINNIETNYNKITGDLVYKYMKQDMVLSQFPTEQIMKLREYLKEKETSNDNTTKLSIRSTNY